MHLRSAALATGLLVSVISVSAPSYHAAAAQVINASPPPGLKAIRLGDDPRRVGLPAGTRVRVALFDGLFLTETQGKAIAELSDGFFKQKRALLGSSLRPQTAADTAANEAFIRREFKAYREVLSPSQRPRFDANVSNIMTARAANLARRGRGR
jgi:hypothetical protein